MIRHQELLHQVQIQVQCLLPALLEVLLQVVVGQQLPSLLQMMNHAMKQITLLRYQEIGVCSLHVKKSYFQAVVGILVFDIRAGLETLSNARGICFVFRILRPDWKVCFLLAEDIFPVKFARLENPPSQCLCICNGIFCKYIFHILCAWLTVARMVVCLRAEDL